MNEETIDTGIFSVDFDRQIPRRGTASVKWDVPREDGVLPLWVADMDFRTAQPIIDALRRRVEDGIYGYALPPRTWRESLVRWLSVRHGWTMSPDSVLGAIGVVPALAAVVRALCRPGDKVVVQPPVYGCFFTTIRNQGCEVLESPLRQVSAPDGAGGDFTYEMDFDDLERKIAQPGVRLFLLCNPHNPAGRSWTADELRRAGDICRRNGVFVVSDEIHADLQMPGSRHVPFASLSDSFRDGSLSFWSASKAFNLAGLQTAEVVCANSSVRELVGKSLETNGTGGLNPFGFVASSVAWDECAGWLDAVRSYIKGNYIVLCDFLRARLPRLRVATLEATYLAWVDTSALGIPSETLVARLEREAKVLFSPGKIFGEARDEAFLRVNLACPRATLAEALERVAAWCDAAVRT